MILALMCRYVLQAQCSDASGECYLQFFNDQVPPHQPSDWGWQDQSLL